MRPFGSHTLSLFAGATISALAGALFAPQPHGVTPQQQQILNMLTLETPPETGGTTTVRLTGANFQIVNGLGQTQTNNGVGNLIVGYNELGNVYGQGDVRTGSHTIVCGEQNSYSTYGGIAAGMSNSILGVFSSSVGGLGNTSSGSYAACLGGGINTASGSGATCLGGALNTASGAQARCSGGLFNVASGQFASTLGGTNNSAVNLLSITP